MAVSTTTTLLQARSRFQRTHRRRRWTHARRHLLMIDAKSVFEDEATVGSPPLGGEYVSNTLTGSNVNSKYPSPTSLDTHSKLPSHDQCRECFQRRGRCRRCSPWRLECLRHSYHRFLHRIQEQTQVSVCFISTNE